MAEKKPKRKEFLKEPDEFITWSARTIEFARQNPRVIAIGASVVALVAIASLVYYGYESRRQATSHEMLETAIRAYERLAVTADSNTASQTGQASRRIRQNLQGLWKSSRRRNRSSL